jgi:hypothetical protein
MKRLFIIGLLLLGVGLFAPAALFAANHMDLMVTLEGEFIGSWYGASVVAMDFNGDGYDDLIVKCKNWNPTGEYNSNMNYGKLYFYWGGPNGLYNLPSYVIEGDHMWQYGIGMYAGQMINAGDLNGDGIDDLLNPERDAEGNYTFAVYFGTANPHGSPDVVCFTQPPATAIGSAYPLGDINGDGRVDVSLIFTDDTLYYISIWDNVFATPYFFRSTNQGSSHLIGIGDVNGDGYADAYRSMPLYVGSNYTTRNTLFFGSANFPIADSLLLSENTLTTLDGSPIGDANGDGFPDFIGYNNNLWLGSPNITAIPDLTLGPYAWTSPDHVAGIRFVHGDFNNDGYEDFVGSNHYFGYYDGAAALWLGGENLNGIVDLYFWAPEGFKNFGFCKAAGDFNGDGCCDLAIAAPFNGSGPDVMYGTGKVYVYSGNSALIDTTVDNSDEYLPSAKLSLRIFPNPVSRQAGKLNLQLSGPGYAKHADLSVELYNLKGQKLLSKNLRSSEAKSGIYSIEGLEFATGVYLLRVKQKNGVNTTGKFIVY